MNTHEPGAEQRLHSILSGMIDDVRMPAGMLDRAVRQRRHRRTRNRLAAASRRRLPHGPSPGKRPSCSPALYLPRSTHAA